MEFARITSKGQMTLPKKVREQCHMQAGDMLAVSVDGDRVTLRRIAPQADDYLKGVEATFSEWNSPQDDEAWRDL